MIGRLDQCCDGAIVNEWSEGQGYGIQDGCITHNGKIDQRLTSMNRWIDRNNQGIAPSRLALAMAVSRETVIDLEHGRATWTFELGRKHVACVVNCAEAKQVDQPTKSTPAEDAGKVMDSLGAENAQDMNLLEAFSEVMNEIKRAVGKFPEWPDDPLHAAGILLEEVGELFKDVLQMTYEPHKTNKPKIKAEAIQSAAMAIRFLLSLERYQYVKSAQHTQITKQGD